MASTTRFVQPPDELSPDHRLTSTVREAVLKHRRGARATLHISSKLSPTAGFEEGNLVWYKYTYEYRTQPIHLDGLCRANLSMDASSPWVSSSSRSDHTSNDFVWDEVLYEYELSYSYAVLRNHATGATIHIRNRSCQLNVGCSYSYSIIPIGDW